MRLVIRGALPLTLETALQFLRQRGLEIVIDDSDSSAPEPATLASECDVLVFDAEHHGDWVARLRADVETSALPIAVWAGPATGRAALEDGADVWLSLDEPPHDLALRLIALSRRAHLGGAPRLDPLTGLSGYRRLQEQLRHEFDRAARYKRSLGLMVIEPDGQEEILRARGVDAADLLLRDVALQLRSLVRDVDMLGRLSGKRFAVVLPETDGTGAVAAGERLRAAIEAQLFTSGASRSPSRGGGPLKLTVSVGVAAIPARGIETAADLMGRALESMIQAQRRGGNRVIPFGASDFIWSRQAPDPSLL
ncbi:MAG: GGDEF domain-containing protein [Acidobacteriota bacterium]